MAQTQHVSSMFTVQGMREFVCTRLTEAAQEILGAFENRAREYELELERQRRLLAIAYSQAGPAGPVDPDIKVEHLDTSVSGISCVSEHISNPNSSQNTDGAEHSPPSPQRPAERSQSPAPDPNTVPKNTPSGPSRCRHGYKLPASRNPSNKDHGKQSEASAAVEIIEIDDKSPASSDVEVVPDNDELRASRDVEDASRKSKGLAGESKIRKSCTKSPPTRLSLPIRHNNENAVDDVSTECPELHVNEGAPTKPHNLVRKANKTNGQSARGKSKSEKSDKTKRDRTTPVQKHTDKETVPEISNGNGKSHGRWHTSEKVFKCEVCGRVFSNNWNLKRHEVIHFQPKPHKCPDCGKGFHKFWNMAAHQDKHRQQAGRDERDELVQREGERGEGERGEGERGEGEE